MKTNSKRRWILAGTFAAVAFLPALGQAEGKVFNPEGKTLESTRVSHWYRDTNGGGPHDVGSKRTFISNTGRSHSEIKFYQYTGRAQPVRFMMYGKPFKGYETEREASLHSTVRQSIKMSRHDFLKLPENSWVSSGSWWDVSRGGPVFEPHGLDVADAEGYRVTTAEKTLDVMVTREQGKTARSYHPLRLVFND